MKFSVALCAAFLVQAVACAAAEGRFYVGAELGRIPLDSDFAQQVTSVHARDVVPPAEIRASVTRATGGRVFAGWRLNPYFAFEVDYAHLGKVTTGYRTFGDFPGTGPGSFTSRTFNNFEHGTEVAGPSVGMTGNLPLSADFAIFAHAAVARLRSKSSVQLATFIGINDDRGIPDPRQSFFVGGAQFDETARQTRPVLGLGLDYGIAERLHLRAAWNRYFDVGTPLQTFEPQGTGRHDIDLIGVGITFDF